MSDDEDRRVEAYDGIVGSGMLTDPERIQKLEAEKARRERGWRGPPEKGFGEVLTETPPKEHERVGVYVPAPLKAKDGEEEPVEAAEGEEEQGAEEAAEGEEGAKGPRVPPDPRMVALHQQFDRAKTTK